MSQALQRPSQQIAPGADVVSDVRRWHALLASGINIAEVNRQISEFATTHGAELAQAGIRNMTYYSQSLSIFEFLLKTEGREFIRTMCLQLKQGKSMADIIARLKAYPKGIPQFEEAWVTWVQAG
jgi:hypothetical protein